MTTSGDTQKETSHFDVFLSHASDDADAVEAIAGLLEKAGIKPFLDKWYLTPGTSWLPEIEDALEHSDSAAVFVGSLEMNPWHMAEMRAGLDRAVRTHDEFRVIPVLLPGAEPSSLPTFLAQRTWVDFRHGLDDQVALERLAAGVRGEVYSDGAYELPDEPAPYRGLLRYEADDASLFFGREADTARLVEALANDRFAAVVGASGCGKSSLVRAGLLAALAGNAGSSRWHTLVFTPGADPLRSLAEQVATLGDGRDRLRTVDDLAERFAASDDGTRQALAALTAEDRRQVLIVVDQFEEIFTMCAASPAECTDTCRRFVANLASSIAGDDAPARVVITLRSDFLTEALAVPQLRELLQDRQLLLGAMSETALREAIVRPAQAVGAFLEKGLVGTILRDAGTEPGTLPALQHALYELWRRRRGPWLTLDAYEKVEGVTGALRRRAQMTYDRLTPSQQEVARHVFLRLTSLAEGTAATRRRVARSELYPAKADPHDIDTVLHSLSAEDARLIVTDEDTVELAHEVLLQKWDTLRRWVEQDQAGLRIHRRLTQAAEDWSTKYGRDPDALYRGTRLAEAIEWRERHDTELNEIEASFLNESRRHERSELDEERRRSRRLRRRLGVAVVALAVALAGIGGTLWALDRATSSEANARARELAAASLETLARDSELAALLAVASAEAPNADAASKAATYAALYGVASSPLLSTFASHSDFVRDAQFSPDGSRILTLSNDRSARVWTDGAASPPLVGPGPMKAGTFSPDGSRVATASGAEVLVWSAEEGNLVDRLGGPAATINSIDYNGDGSLLVAASDDRNAWVWESDSTDQPQSLPHDGPVNSAEFNQAGTHIVTASSDGTARVWDVAGNEIAVMGDHDDKVLTAEWSPDGSLIVTASEDNTARVWRLAGSPVATLSGHTNFVTSAHFNHDGTRIVTASSDNTARIWEIDGTESLSLAGHVAPLTSADFSSDGRWVVTASVDGAVRVWPVDGGPATVFEGRDQWVHSARFSPDDGLVVAALDDGTAQIWALDPQMLAEIEAHDKGALAVAVAPSGAFVTGGKDGKARLWSPEGQPRTGLDDHAGEVKHVQYSPDGTRIVTSSDDGSARLWNSSGELINDLDGHDGSVSFADFSRDGKWIVTAGTDGTARMWDSDGDPGPVLIGHGKHVRKARFSRDGSLIVTAGDEGAARVWNKDGTEQIQLIGHDGLVLNAQFSPDGTRVVTASADGTARIWNLDGTSEPELRHRGQVLDAVFSPDGGLIVTASADRTARLWRGDGTPVSVLNLHTGAVLSATFSPDGDRILTFSEDKSARVWGRDGTPLGVLSGHSGSVVTGAFSADGRRIITIDTAGFARIWNSWSYEDALSAAGERTPGRQFTLGECTRYAIKPCPVDR